MFGSRLEPRLAAIEVALNEMRDTLQHEFELNRREFALNREARANDRAVLTELTRQIQASIEDNRRHNDATVGALTDLAAEIRGWGGGAAPA